MTQNDISHCYFCGDEASDEHHVIPRDLNPPESVQNTVMLCRSCHQKAHQMFYKTYADYISPSNSVKIVMGEILKKAAEYEQENRPYRDRSSGFERSDLNSENQHYIIEEWMLKKSEQLGYIESVWNMGKFGRYRMTDKGWRRVDTEKPTTGFDWDDFPAKWKDKEE